MKKITSILLSIAILATMCSQSIFAYASNVIITANNVNTEYSKTFDVNVSISGNNDLMGFAFEISYDSNAVKPISVTPSPALENGTFNDSIGSDIYVNPMRVVWADTQPLTTDGELFTVEFEALKIGTSDITISPINADTYDSSYNQVNISECTITVNSDCRHNYRVESVAPTCISKGVNVYKCVSCNEVFTEYVNELEHNAVTDAAVKPTCTKSGLTEGSHCSVCKAVIVKQQIIDPIGHNFENNSSVCLKCGESNPYYVASNTEITSAENEEQGSVALPDKTTIKKLQKGKKSFKITWTKISGVTGYQVQYATDKKFKKNKKTVSINNSKSTSKTISKLNANKKYYVRIRTYKTINGTKYYSKWSTIKTVTTKK